MDKSMLLWLQQCVNWMRKQKNFWWAQQTGEPVSITDHNGRTVRYEWGSIREWSIQTAQKPAGNTTASCVQSRWTAPWQGGTRSGRSTSTTDKGAFQKREPPADILPDGSVMKLVCWESCHIQMHSASLTAFSIPMMRQAIKLLSEKKGGDFQRKAAATSMPMTGCTGWQGLKKMESRCAVTSMIHLETVLSWKIIREASWQSLNMMP